MLKAYADHHVVRALIQALRVRGMDVVTAKEDGRSAANDEELLAAAFAQERILLTNDKDFLVLARERAANNETFAPIFFWPQQRRGTGEIMRRILQAAKTCSYDEACSQVFFL